MAAFDELGFAPHVADLPDHRDLTTTVLGHGIDLPVLISPTGVQAVHPDGEIAVARAAAGRGTVMCLSAFASKPIEDVLAVNARTLFQVHWTGDRDHMARLLDRAAGAAGLIATLDWTFSHGRDGGSPVLPERVDLATMLRYAPDVLAHPRWLAAFLKAKHIPDLRVPNMPGAPRFFDAYRAWQRTPPPTWQDIAWLRERWAGPFVLKGISRVADARRAADIGATAVCVSNHGGNNLDGTPATIRLLPAIAAAVDIEVLLDGGIRRGGDVVKAIALGARAVLIGRAYLWGLAAAGEAGVARVLDILRRGIDSTLLGLGRASVRDLTRNDLLPHPCFSPPGAESSDEN